MNRRVIAKLAVAVAMITAAGCNAIVGIDDHLLAGQGDSSTGGNGEPTGPDAAIVGTDGAAPDGRASDSGASGATPDGSGDAAPDAGVDAYSPGRAVTASACSNEAGTCVLGATLTGGGRPNGPNRGALPDGGVVILVDDGFELGATLCDSTGTTCITGALSP